jgi:hypothetical protein
MIENKIGTAAGTIWQKLREKGPMSRRELSKQTGLSADLANQGIGWLAREGKLALDDGVKGRALLKLRS